MVVLSAFVSIPGKTSSNAGQRADFVIAYLEKSFPDIDPKDATAALAVWVGEFGRELGYSVESRLYPNAEAVIRNVQNGGVDFVVLSSIEYLRVRKKVEGDLAVAAVRGGKTSRRYLLVVSAKRGLSRPGDLKGKKLLLVKGDEFGSMFLDTVLLQQRKGEAQGFFSSIEEKARVSQVVLPVYFGSADACIVNDVSFKTITEMNPQLARELKVIASSPELTDYIAFFRKATQENLKRTAVRVCMTLKERQRGRQVLMLFKMEGLAPIKETDLTTVRDLVSEYERLRGGRS